MKRTLRTGLLSITFALAGIAGAAAQTTVTLWTFLDPNKTSPRELALKQMIADFEAKNPAIRIIAVQPSEGHDVPGLRNKSELHVTKLFDEKQIDEILEIPFELAYTRVLELCRTEGLFAGPSSGLIYEGARRVLERDTKQKGVGVMMFCDNVFKYVSSMVRHVPGLGEE